MTRPASMLLAAALLCLTLAPAAGAATRVLSVPVPDSGDVSVANVSFKGKAKRLRAPVVANAGALNSPLTVVGGVKRAGGGKLLATVVVVRRDGGSPGASKVAVGLRGIRFSKLLRRQVVRSVIGTNKKPPYCASLPASFAHVKALFGKPLSGFSAPETAQVASSLRCRSSDRQSAFLAGFRDDGGEGVNLGGEGSGTGSSGSGPGNECARTESEEACAGEEQGPSGPKTSSTLHGSGSVTRDPADPRRFTYSVSFNEPVIGYRISVGTKLYCPASLAAAWYDSCPPESKSPGEGLRCEQPGGSSVNDFTCWKPMSEDAPPPPPVPAGTTFNGSYLTDPNAAPSTASSVRLVGIQADAESQGDQIPIS
jgi:hypothetical protein